MYTSTVLAGVLACLTKLVAADPMLPSQDPFYVQPANISKYALGAIVRSRDVTDNVNGLSQLGATINVQSAYQFMYRSNDSLATPVGDVMTFLTPNGGNSSRLLSYSTAYDAANNDCSPSYALQKGANVTTGGDIVNIVQALNNGWYVVVSDFEGLKAEFTVGVQAGHAVLDSIKASFTTDARKLTGLSANAVWAMFGYSGGAIGAEYAAEMAATYAPKLETKLLGTAIGGLTANISNVLQTVNGGFASGVTFKGAYGYQQAFQNVSDYVESELKPLTKSDYYQYATSCSAAQGGFKNFFNYFKDGAKIAYSAVLQTVLSGSGQMGVHGIPRRPMYVYKGFFDELSPVEDTTEVVEKYCDNGARITYEINYLTGHFVEALVGTPAAFQYIADRFAGKPVPAGCVYQDFNLTQIVSAGDAFSSDNLGFLSNILKALPKSWPQRYGNEHDNDTNY